MGFDLKKAVSGVGAGIGGAAKAVGGAAKGLENSSAMDALKSLGGGAKESAPTDAWEMGPIVQGFGNGAGNGGKGGGGTGGKGGKGGRASMAPGFPGGSMLA